MNTKEVKARIAESSSGEDALDLLLEVMPNASARFHRLTNNLAKYLAEVREYYPDAMFYTTGGYGFALLLGSSHSGPEDSANNELMALSATKLTVEGGDW